MTHDGRSLGVPLEAGGRRLGTLIFSGAGADARREAEAAGKLHLIAEVFASALARKESEDGLRAGEEMKSAILASLSGEVAVLDRAGRIIARQRGVAHGRPRILAGAETAEGVRFGAGRQARVRHGGIRFPQPRGLPLVRAVGGALAEAGGRAVAARTEVTERRRRKTTRAAAVTSSPTSCASRPSAR
jgi:hypothetical protein